MQTFLLVLFLSLICTIFKIRGNFVSNVLVFYFMNQNPYLRLFSNTSMKIFKQAFILKLTLSSEMSYTYWHVEQFTLNCSTNYTNSMWEKKMNQQKNSVSEKGTAIFASATRHWSL